ncbi:MAG: MlaD family protein [Bacteroidetes bacterium]|nr:MlaD family protein [Bacteroidota bacterium]
MKKSTGNKMKLGIFVSISITLFIVGIYFIGQRQQLFSSTFQISGIFRDISGLQVGNNVRFSGINIGIIENIEQITDSTVKVDMVINEDTRRFIKKNAKAIIGSDGLMGNKIILIIPGPVGKKQLNNNDTIETAQAVSMDDILIKIKVTADNAAFITEDLAIIMQSIREGKGTIGKLLMDSTLAQNLDGAIVNIKQGAGGFKNNMDAAGKNVLLRGFFKRKNKEKERQKEKEAEKK